jgi:4-hydroxy-tetrahydrodipicolinate synthase
MKELKGLGVAMVTPFTKSGEVDVKGLKALTEHIITGGADYLVVLGTTGESVTLNKEEKKLVIDTILASNNGRKPIVLGIGGNNTTEVANQLSRLEAHGIDAILSVTPYYNKPNQNGLYEHYKTLSEVSKLPIILYNVPGRTSVNLLPDTVSKIAFDCRNIIGIKEASGNVEQVMSVIQQTPKEFMVISGDDALTLPLIASGADGVISVVGNAFPKEFSEMVHLSLEGKIEEARAIHYRLLDIIHLLFKEGNPTGVKEVLAQLDVCENYLRLPLVEASDNLSDQLRREMIDQGFLS